MTPERLNEIEALCQPGRDVNRVCDFAYFGGVRDLIRHIREQEARLNHLVPSRLRLARKALAWRELARVAQERLHALVECDPVKLKQFHYDENGIEMVTSGGGVVAELFAAAFWKDLKDAPNYIEYQLRGTTQAGPLLGVVTVQKVTGKTPHQKRQEAEAERDSLKDALRELVDACTAVPSNGGMDKDEAWGDRVGNACNAANELLGKMEVRRG